MGFLDHPTTNIFLGALLTFIATIILNHYKERKDKRTNILKQLEELFILLDKSATKTRNTLVYIQSKEPVNLESDDTNAKISFLIRVYFPSINSIFLEYVNKSTEFGVYQAQVALLTKEEFNQQQDSFIKKQKLFEEAHTNLLNKIIEEASNYI